MANATIDVNSSLLSYASTASSGATTIEGGANALKTSLISLTEAIAPLTREPIIGPGATAFLEAVSKLGTATTFVFSCIGTDLTYMGSSMTSIEQTFSTTDKNLQALFTDLSNLLAAEVKP